MPYKDAEKNAECDRKRRGTEKRRAQISRCQKKRRVELKQRAFSKLGNKCSNPACQWLNLDGSRGCTDYRCLQVDHTHGGGHAERKAGVVGERIYQAVLADQENRYQLLCANCNWIKRFENKENRGDSRQ